MIQAYPWLKLIHILSATLLFGTGLGTAFYMWRADRSGDLNAIAVVSKNVVLADWLFTTPAVLLQPLTGLAMIWLAGMPLNASWVGASLLLYGLVGACWLPVVVIQTKVARMAAQAVAQGSPMPPGYRRWMRWWYGLGWPAFIGVLAIFWLMVMKPV